MLNSGSLSSISRGISSSLYLSYERVECSSYTCSFLMFYLKLQRFAQPPLPVCLTSQSIRIKLQSKLTHRQDKKKICYKENSGILILALIQLSAVEFP